MARFRSSLYVKVLLWFLVNLLLLAVLGWIFISNQFRVGLDWMLAGPTGARIEQLANEVSADLRMTTQDQWPNVLKKHGEEHGLAFALFRSDGRQLMGEPLEVPQDIRIKLIDRRAPSDLPPPPSPRAQAAKLDRARDDAPPAPPPKPRFIMRSEQPTLYWAGIHIDVMYREGSVNVPLTVVMISRSLTAGGLFFDPWPWLALAAGGLLLSVLMWLPFVTSLTAAIHRLNVAARRIARGRFEVRVPQQRKDELGELSASLNEMAQQLGEYMQAQRRITADVAHELCSPLARMQMALGVVEQRGTPEQATYLKKLDGEMQHMARLVEEVLAFSKADTLPDRESAADVNLSELVDQVIAREAAGHEVEKLMPEGLTLHTLREALDRALGNVLRNAVRYAGQAGPIQIEARVADGRTVITVRDQGPGVPPEALPRLFEAFYRPEVARGRHTGGSGLGLAIVKRCIAACNGTVTARLREPTGLEVEMVV